MSKILSHEIDTLKRDFLSLGALVEEALKKSIRALETNDVKTAQAVIDADAVVDQKEVDLEENCLKILALHQPVAQDLRFIIALLKINNDLERIGDLACNISKRVIFIAETKSNFLPLAFVDMGAKTQVMLRKSLDSLVQLSRPLALEVCRDDDEIDALYRRIFLEVKEEIRRSPENLDTFVNFFSIARFLERIADYATNIAEDVIYAVDGEIIRHKKNFY